MPPARPGRRRRVGKAAVAGRGDGRVYVNLGECALLDSFGRASLFLFNFRKRVPVKLLTCAARHASGGYIRPLSILLAPSTTVRRAAAKRRPETPHTRLVIANVLYYYACAAAGASSVPGAFYPRDFAYSAGRARTERATVPTRDNGVYIIRYRYPSRIPRDHTQ